jgi:hypothetical protein
MLQQGVPEGAQQGWPVEAILGDGWGRGLITDYGHITD